MNEHSRHSDDTGFTLVEVLVTVLILGLLAAVVFPVVIGQVSKADPTKVSNDLANIRTGVELFELDVRPREPGDIDDLIEEPNSSDTELDGSSSFPASSPGWEGPYVDISSTSTMKTGFDADIQNTFVRFNSASTTGPTAGAGASEANYDFLAIQVNNLNSAQAFDDVDDQIDGTVSSSTGRFRGTSSTAYYLAVPRRGN